MVARQLSAATFKSLGVISIWTSFCASVKVVVETTGPTSGAVPKAGGAPGGRSAGFCASLRSAAAAPKIPRDVCVMNCLRDFDMNPPTEDCIRDAETTAELRSAGQTGRLPHAVASA